jgi:hypothetical protein
MSIATEATLIILNTDKQYRFTSLVDVMYSESKALTLSSINSTLFEK